MCISGFCIIFSINCDPVASNAESSWEFPFSKFDQILTKIKSIFFDQFIPVSLQIGENEKDKDSHNI